MQLDVGMLADVAAGLGGLVQPHVLLHASGVLRDGVVANQHAAGLRAVFAAKASDGCVEGLVDMLVRRPMQSTVLFSSVAVPVAAAGQVLLFVVIVLICICLSIVVVNVHVLVYMHCCVCMGSMFLCGPYAPPITNTQSNYVAVNSTLDALAVCLQATGVATTSIQWGAWDSPGTENLRCTVMSVHVCGVIVYIRAFSLSFICTC